MLAVASGSNATSSVDILIKKYIEKMKNKDIAPEHDYRSPSFDELNRVGNSSFCTIIFLTVLITIQSEMNFFGGGAERNMIKVTVVGGIVSPVPTKSSDLHI